MAPYSVGPLRSQQSCAKRKEVTGEGPVIGVALSWPKKKRPGWGLLEGAPLGNEGESFTKAGGGNGCFQEHRLGIHTAGWKPWLALNGQVAW